VGHRSLCAHVCVCDMASSNVSAIGATAHALEAMLAPKASSCYLFVVAGVITHALVLLAPLSSRYHPCVILLAPLLSPVEDVVASPLGWVCDICHHLVSTLL